MSNKNYKLVILTTLVVLVLLIWREIVPHLSSWYECEM